MDTARNHSVLHSDVFVPKRGVTLDEIPHEVNTLLILENVNEYAAGAKKLFLPEEGPVLADDDAWDPIQENRS